VEGDEDAVNPAREGTKAALRYVLDVPAEGTRKIRLRLNDRKPARGHEIAEAFDETLRLRRREADEFYATILPATLSDDASRVARQALAGLLWSKQYYHYVVRDWLAVDPSQPPPPAG